MAHRKYSYTATLVLTPALGGVDCSVSRAGCFFPSERTLFFVGARAGWTPGPVCACLKMWKYLPLPGFELRFLHAAAYSYRQTFPATYFIETGAFTVFTRTHHRSLSWARWTHCTPSHSISHFEIFVISLWGKETKLRVIFRGTVIYE
jgi:hypothetical protein